MMLYSAMSNDEHCWNGALEKLNIIIIIKKY